MLRTACTLCLIVLMFLAPALVAGQQVCQTMDTIPGFANEYLVDIYHEQIVERLQTATNLDQVLVAVYSIGNDMVAAGDAVMVPAGMKIVILNTKPLTGTSTSGTGVMNHPTQGERPEVKLKGRLMKTGEVFWFHSNGLDFGQ